MTRGPVGATRDRLRTLFSDTERKTASQQRQPHDTVDALYKVAGERQSRFEQILDRGKGIAKALGARVQSTATPEAFRKAQNDVADNPDVPHVIVAALKGKARAQEKVAGKYLGDASRLTDIVRGTVLVPHVDDLPTALEAVRANLPAGWTIVKPENRFVHSPGDRVNTGDLGGYRDVSLLLRAPDGFLAELQINTTAMWLEKEMGEGHRLYEESRRIRERAVAAGRDLSVGEAKRIREIEARSRAIYDAALRRSSKPHPTGKITV